MARFTEVKDVAGEHAMTEQQVCGLLCSDDLPAVEVAGRRDVRVKPPGDGDTDG